MICYGLDQCIQSAEQGALDSVLIVDTLFKTKKENEKEMVSKLMDQIDKTRVTYYIVDNKSENGRIIKNFGGILGLLRYAIVFSS